MSILGFVTMLFYNIIFMLIATLIIATITLTERKVLALVQRRVGPNFVGYKGRLQYLADAGTRWAYHNVYVKLQDVVSSATGQTWNTYFNTKLRDKIGMNTNGFWFTNTDGNRIYWSTTRSMARFGLLALNKGKWNSSIILNENYFNEATSTSQTINQSYGYLWWLNGKTSYHLPQTQLQFNGSLVPTAPNDMFCALGKNDQKIYIVPSKKMVVIRMGDPADSSNLALSTFDEVLWQKINTLYQ